MSGNAKGAGARIIDGLQEAARDGFSAVCIDGQYWVCKHADQLLAANERQETPTRTALLEENARLRAALERIADPLSRFLEMPGIGMARALGKIAAMQDCAKSALASTDYPAAVGKAIRSAADAAND
jgi:hypothetical protein